MKLFVYILFLSVICTLVRNISAAREVTLKCGSDERTPRGPPGYPGKQGPKGNPGAPGEKGNPGLKGDSGDCSTECQVSDERIEQLEADLRAFKECVLMCLNGRCVSKNNSLGCECNHGYTGEMCNSAICIGAQLCGERGQCVSPGKCRCNSGYQGESIGCQNFTCDDSPCAANSRCIGPNQCDCVEGYIPIEGQCSVIANCEDASRSGITRSGVYNITVHGRTMQKEVYCDLDTDGGGWLVFQRRTDGSVNFYKNWVQYQQGFGQLNGEFWLGLETLHAITSVKSYTLRIDMEDWEGRVAYASYRSFSVGNNVSNYRLNIGRYSGNAGNSLGSNNNFQFSTKDRDNDALPSQSCAQEYRGGAYWYTDCGRSNLNGEYFRGGVVNRRGVAWFSWKNNWYSMKRVEMKIKPN